MDKDRTISNSRHNRLCTMSRHFNGNRVTVVLRTVHHPSITGQQRSMNRSENAPIAPAIPHSLLIRIINARIPRINAPGGS